MNLSGKNILFIGPVFHDYHEAINNLLKENNANVDFFPERKYGIAFKLINNYFNKDLAQYQKSHYRSILKEIAGKKYDYLFVIRGYMMDKDFIDEFSRNNPDAKKIMYQWDSERTNKFTHLIPYFNQVYSFDFEDCENNPQLLYQPLFYTKDVSDAMKLNHSIEYDYFFMGGYLPERYNAVLKFRDYASANNQRLKAFIYLPFSTFLKEKLKGKRFDFSVVSFFHMKRATYLNYLMRSKAIIDVSNSGQTGLAMRIIEALACNKKVITNNKYILGDRLYTGKKIAVFNENAPEVNLQFLNSTESDDNKNVLSIERWLNKIFEN